MNSAQKSIKCIATVFAIFLIVTIFGAIFSVGALVLRSVGIISPKVATSSLDHSKYSSYVDINLNYANLVIKNGETLKVDNNNDNIKVELDNNKLIITDKSSFFSKRKDEELVVYIPSYMKYDIVNISTGAGKIDAAGFKTKEVILNLGAGAATFRNIYSDKSDISTGTGSVKISDSVLNDAKLDLGVGKISIDSNITGNSKIDCGIGSVELKLPGSRDEYTFDINKGLGKITYNENSDVGDKSKIGNGENFIKIDGGIGSISITTN